MNQNGGSVVIGIADFILIASIFSLSIFGKQIADCDDKNINCDDENIFTKIENKCKKEAKINIENKYILILKLYVVLITAEI